MKLDISKKQDALASRLTGEVRDSSAIGELRRMLSDTISELLETVDNRFVDEVTSFRTEIEKLKNGFSGKLLKNIDADFNKLLQQFENKEKEIANYEVLITLFKKVQ